jgi:hypothetical protein
VAMRRGATLLAIAALAQLPAGATAGKQHKHKPKPAGVRGVVLDSTCFGPCVDPPPPQPAYNGPVTVTVQRASDGALVASQAISDGRFRIRVKRGLYDVSSVPPNPPPCEPTPDTVCPAQGDAPSKEMIAPCLAGETKRVRVKRHRFSHVELHVQNVCVV